MSDVGTEGAGEASRPEPTGEDSRDAGPTDASADLPDPEVESVEPSDAFEALGNEVRMTVLRALVDDGSDDAEADDTGAHDAGADDASDDPDRISGRTMTFSELFEASPADTTAGFAYHLRQLTDTFLEKTGDDEDRYALTYAGLQVARAIAAGTYTDRVSFDPIPTGDPCPLCDSGELAATCEANYVTVACGDCGRAVLTLPFPPGARRDGDAERLLEAFDRHHRHRLSVMSDGICPECAATMDAELARPSPAVTAALPDSDAERAQVRLDCGECGCRLHSPVTLAVLEHPAVVAFYHDHGENVRDRPVWNVGDEWRETVVSTEPWCVRVSTALDDEALDLFVAGDLSVAGTQRRPAGDARPAS